MDRDGSGPDQRRSNLTDAVAGSLVLWPGEKVARPHDAAGRVCLPLVVGDGWLGEPLGVGQFDSLVDAKCLPIYAHPYWLSAQCGQTNWSHRAGAHRCSASVLVRLCRRVVRGDAVRGGRPVQFDGDALRLYWLSDSITFSRPYPLSSSHRRVFGRRWWTRCWAALDRERQDHIAVLVGLIRPTQQVGDLPDQVGNGLRHGAGNLLGSLVRVKVTLTRRRATAAPHGRQWLGEDGSSVV